MGGSTDCLMLGKLIEILCGHDIPTQVESREDRKISLASFAVSCTTATILTIFQDDERIDVDRTLNRIINGVFHHPALRNAGDDGARDGRGVMFNVVQQWWGSKSDYEKDDLRQKLSREGVETGQNHKEGVEDSGHGCCKPLGLPKPSKNAPAAAAHAAVMQGLNQAMSGGQNQGGYNNRPSSGSGFQNQASGAISEAVGGGVLGNVIGGLVGGVGASLLGGAFDDSSNNGAQTQTFQNSNYNDDGSYTTSTIETGHRPQTGGYGSGGYNDQTAQAEYKTTQYPGGGYKQEYNRFDQSGSSGHGYEQSVETRPVQGGGYEQRSEERWEEPDGRWESDVQRQSIDGRGQHHQTEERHHGHRRNGSDEEDDDDDDDEKKERKRREKERKKREKEERERYGGGNDDSDSSKHGHRKHGSRDDETRHGGNSYEQQQQRPQNDFPGSNYGGESFDNRRNRYEESSGYGRQEQQFESGYGQQRPQHGGFGEGPPPQRQGYGGDEYGGRPGGFGGDFEQPPRRHGGYGGGEEEMPGGFPGEEEEPRRHGHHGGQHGGGGYGGGSGYGGGY